jgi:hypothetical protein
MLPILRLVSALIVDAFLLVRREIQIPLKVEDHRNSDPTESGSPQEVEDHRNSNPTKSGSPQEVEDH